MSHLFVKLPDSNYDSINGPALIVKNVSRGPFEIDEDGRILPSMAIAAIDDSCSKCAEGIKNGKLVVLQTISGAKQQKQKTKNASSSNQDVAPATQETAPASNGETTTTVAPSEDNGSVQ